MVHTRSDSPRSARSGGYAPDASSSSGLPPGPVSVASPVRSGDRASADAVAAPTPQPERSIGLAPVDEGWTRKPTPIASDAEMTLAELRAQLTKAKALTAELEQQKGQVASLMGTLKRMTDAMEGMGAAAKGDRLFGERSRGAPASKDRGGAERVYFRLMDGEVSVTKPTLLRQPGLLAELAGQVDPETARENPIDFDLNSRSFSLAVEALFHGDRFNVDALGATDRECVRRAADYLHIDVGGDKEAAAMAAPVGLSGALAAYDERVSAIVVRRAWMQRLEDHLSRGAAAPGPVEVVTDGNLVEGEQWLIQSSTYGPLRRAYGGAEVVAANPDSYDRRADLSRIAGVGFPVDTAARSEEGSRTPRRTIAEVLNKLSEHKQPATAYMVDFFWYDAFNAFMSGGPTPGRLRTTGSPGTVELSGQAVFYLAHVFGSPAPACWRRHDSNQDGFSGHWPTFDIT